jgi:aminopeptidase N
MRSQSLREMFNEAWEMGNRERPGRDQSQVAKAQAFRAWMSGAVACYNYLARAERKKLPERMADAARELDELRTIMDILE